MVKIVIDAADSVLGRVGSYVAKELLKGNSVEVINSEKVIISGSHSEFVAKVKAKRNMGRGASLKGQKIEC